MSDLAWSDPPPRAELLAGVREGLGELGTSLRVIAQDLLGADARIDLVAVDPDGRIHLTLLASAGDDLVLVALGLAQRTWVEARLPDWIQLAPRLGLQPDATPRLVLVAPEFSPTTLAAVRAADAVDIDLVRYRCLAGGGGEGPRVLLEPVRIGGAAGGPPARRLGRPPPAARFRTGLADGDLTLTRDERRGLD